MDEATPTYYEVLSNLRHDGMDYVQGSVIEGSYDTLVADGVVRVVDGAESMEDAKRIVEEDRAARAQASEEGDGAPVGTDTWAATEEEAPAEAPVDPAGTEEKPVADVVATKKYTVQAENGVILEGDATERVYAKGEVVEINPESEQGKWLVANAVVTEVAAEPIPDGNAL